MSIIAHPSSQGGRSSQGMPVASMLTSVLTSAADQEGELARRAHAQEFRHLVRVTDRGRATRPGGPDPYAACRSATCGPGDAIPAASSGGTFLLGSRC